VPDIKLQPATKDRQRIAKTKTEPKAPAKASDQQEKRVTSKSNRDVVPEIVLQPAMPQPTAVAAKTKTKSAKKRSTVAATAGRSESAVADSPRSASNDVILVAHTAAESPVSKPTKNVTARPSHTDTAGRTRSGTQQQATNQQATSVIEGRQPREIQLAAPVNATDYTRYRAQSRAQRANYQVVEQLPAPAGAENQSAPVGQVQDPCAAVAGRPFYDFGISTTVPTGELPIDVAAGCWENVNATAGPLPGYRAWSTSMFAWDATCLCYRPLYFEEANLERYGYGCCETMQPLASAAHFFGTIPLLPYCMAVDCPNECIYTLGHYRPGSCVPKRYMWPPVSPRAILAEGGVWTGLVFLIP
jgi:hypothetical protein